MDQRGSQVAGRVHRAKKIIGKTGIAKKTPWIWDDIKKDKKHRRDRDHNKD